MPTRNSHSSTSSTSHLLTWTELPPLESSAAVASGHRARQPSDKISEVLHGSQLAGEEATKRLTKKKSCSGYKMKEMAGSGMFSYIVEDTTSEANGATSENRTSIRVYKQGKNGISPISFSTEESICPKKPTSLPKAAAKQRELSGTMHSQTDRGSKRQISSAKAKELSGNDIFGLAPEIVPRSLQHARTLTGGNGMGEPVLRNALQSLKVNNPGGGQSNVLFGGETVQMTSKKLYDQKFSELTGSNIFKEDVPPTTAEKHLSNAKLREMRGSDIFSDGKAEITEYLRGPRRTPRGGSIITSV